MEREHQRNDPRGDERSPDLGALFAALAPLEEASLAPALDGLLERLASGTNVGSAPRDLVAALVAAGANGAELWVHGTLRRGGWRRLAGAGTAVPDADHHVHGLCRGYPGPVGVVHAGALALAFCGALPGSDERERHEDLAETLLALAAAYGLGAEDPARDLDGPLGAA